MEMEIFKKFINELGDITENYIAGEFKQNISWDLKNDHSPVTRTDKNTELMLRERIKAKFPDHGIIGEEYGNENTDAEYVWVLDPIDGTKSYITKVPLFGTLVALMRNNQPILGMINQPILKQRMIGDNNECLFNGKPVKVSPETDIAKATVLTSDTRGVPFLHSRQGWYDMEKKCYILRSWGDCYGYMLLCRGLAHVMIDAQLEIWDIMALLPNLKGAGATVGDLCGGNDHKKHGCMACCTKHMFDECVKILNPKE